MNGANHGVWKGWHSIWKLGVMPRIKIFVWKLSHGKLITGVYLYHLNLDPHTLCPFCSFMDETQDHVIWNCSKLACYWQSLFGKLGLSTSAVNSLQSGNWLTIRFDSRDGDHWVKAMIAIVAWLIWKERCNLIFKNIPPNLNSIYHHSGLVSLH